MTDTARLNFLIRRQAYVVPDGEPGYTDHVVVDYAHGRTLGRGDTPREAIDDAIGKERP